MEHRPDIGIAPTVRHYVLYVSLQISFGVGTANATARRVSRLSDWTLLAHQHRSILSSHFAGIFIVPDVDVPGLAQSQDYGERANAHPAILGHGRY